eukprot:7116036-Pyramimonas_sp.AAC.1
MARVLIELAAADDPRRRNILNLSINGQFWGVDLDEALGAEDMWTHIMSIHNRHLAHTHREHGEVYGLGVHMEAYPKLKGREQPILCFDFVTCHVPKEQDAEVEEWSRRTLLERTQQLHPYWCAQRQSNC